MTVRAEEGGEESKLHAAIRVHNLKLVRAALCDEGLDIDAVGVYGWTALHEAASCGHQDIVLILLDHGADPDIQDSVQKCTPIHFAARNGHLEVVRSLVRSGARIDLRNAAGKIPQDWADEQCREFLQRERLTDVIKVTSTPVEDTSLVHKLYRNRSSQNPRQSSPQWSESSQGSRESMAASSLDSSESFGLSSTSSIDLQQPGPGEIRFSLNFNRERQTLIAHIGDIRDVKLPADHSLSHIYIKLYIVPDHKRATKRKTPLLILERKNEKANSKNNVKSFDSEDEDSRKGSAMHARRKIVSSLRRGSQFSLKKKKDNDQVTSLQGNAVAIYRLSTTFNETFRYDSVNLKRVNFDNSSVMVILCGRNRVTTKAQPIASLCIPFSRCCDYSALDWYPLVYKIKLPQGHFIEERQEFKPSDSVDEQGGRVSGKSMAWNDRILSMSMPSIEFSGASSAPSRTFPLTSQGGDGSSEPRRQKKHSGPGRLLRKEFKLAKGKPNTRYQNSAAADVSGLESTAVNDVMEISSSTLPPNSTHRGSDFHTTGNEHHSGEIATKSRALPRGGTTESGRNTRSRASAISIDYVPEVVSLDDEEPSLEPRSSFVSSLKYSRACQRRNTAQKQDVVVNDLECEEVDTEIPDVPFSVSNLLQTGIVCN